MTNDLPSRDALKQQAKALRLARRTTHHPITHSQALELVAHRYGFRDWNALAASAPVSETGRLAFVKLGARVSGAYLGHVFTGHIHALSQRSGAEHVHVTVRFDAPIDVVTSPHFSAFRRQVNATLDATGVTPQRLSNGMPHMILRAA